MFKRILVPLDGGPRGEVALAAARGLSQAWEAQLDILGLAASEDEMSSTESAVDRQAAALDGETSVNVRLATSSVGEDIAAAMEASPPSPVVMATSARKRSAALVESVSDTVLRSTEGPVLLIGPNASVPTGWPSGPMFVCTDGSESSEEILGHVASMSEGLDLSPWLITVHEPSKTQDSKSAGIKTNYSERLASKLEKMIRRGVNYDVLHGSHPAKAIVEYAKRHDASLIALSTHGRTGIQRLALGSVAMEVVHDAHCPVLVARPAI